MATSSDSLPDLRAGIAIGDLVDGGMRLGRVDQEDAILLRRGDSLFAVSAQCSHYGGPLAEGLIVGETLRCPLHHACFDIRTGSAIRAPALDPIACWRVERIGDIAYVRDKLPAPSYAVTVTNSVQVCWPDSVVIVGGGAAGLAAADTLRRQGYQGSVRMISADSVAPVDRPNLSKDFLAGTASEDWIPLRPVAFYAEHNVELVLGARVVKIEVAEHKRVVLEDGREFAFGALLLATGADPVRLDIVGATPSQILYLRSFDDSRAIVARAAAAKRVIVLGASFIGLEVAASLRERGIDVHVVGREQLPMERVLGKELGRFIQALHESHGVVFHLGTTIDHMDGDSATLADGTVLQADFVVAGVGVRPAIALAEQSGLAIDRGVVVDEYLQTSAPGIYAAGDIARWPDARSGERIRVEHWVVAERQGQTAALNILGGRKRFDAVPFFWSLHYDVSIKYVGHAESWERIELDGSLEHRDAKVSYKRGGRLLAAATVSRNLQNLQIEHAMETGRD